MINGSSLITLNEESVTNNIRFLKKKLGRNVRISSVVKANAYGHGIEQIVPMFEKAGLDHFSVFSFREATRVKASLSGDATIMIMGWISDHNIRDAIIGDYEFYIFNIERLQVAMKYALETTKKARIHIEIETGMNRSGLNSEELNRAVKIITDNPECFNVAGVTTHLAGAESISNHVRIKKQISRYHKTLTYLAEQGIDPGVRHIANSAAAFVYPKARLDMVRIGIMQYGFWSSTETFIQYLGNRSNRKDPLKRVLGWESRIMSIKEVKIGEYIGYGISFLAQSVTRTALIPVGYSSGYSRSLSNKGHVLIHGTFCNVLGLVNMNMIIADITNVPDVVVGDQVVIIGRQGEQEIKVSSFSDISDQLNYEVLAHLSGGIKRNLLIQ